MKRFKPQLICVEKKALDYYLTREILERLPGVPVEEVESARAKANELRQAQDPIGAGKRILLLAHDEGRSFKPFPEAEQYLSCDYYTLHLAEGCDLECSYCILQAYLTNPLLIVYVNVGEMLENLSVILSANKDKFFRIGTGQLADSLSMDHITGFTEHLVPFFNEQENAILELKTKSDNVERLLHLKSGGKTVVSWSMNAEEIQHDEEHKTATLEERLSAAEKICARTDHRVGFHFDPVIDFPGWEESYGKTIRNLFSRIPSERIAWISLGCLRFMPSLKPIMESRFPNSPLPRGEWIRGMDGKMRYFKPVRIAIYRELVRRIRAIAPEVTLYLSMESPEVWKEVFGGEHSKSSVCTFLDLAAQHGSSAAKTDQSSSGRQSAGKKATPAPSTVSQKITE